MIRRIPLRTAANCRHADAVGVAEMNLESGNRLAVLQFHQGHPVSSPELLNRSAFGKQSDQSIAATRHRLGTHGVQRQEDVVASLSETTNPVLRVAIAGIAYQLCAFGGAANERTEGFE